MSGPDDPEPDSNTEPAKHILEKLRERAEERLRTLEDIDIETLGLDQTKRLVREVRMELLQQTEDLRRAQRIAIRGHKQAAEELQWRKAESNRVEQDLSRQTAELTAENVRLEDEKYILAAVMEALPAGVAITDQAGRIILTNKAFGKLWGDPLPETRSVEDYGLYKAWWGDTDIPVAPEEWAAAIAVRQGETTLGQMMRIRRFDGNEVHVLNSASPVYDDQGKIIGSAVAVQDISELKRIQKALYESEQRLRLFIEHAPVALAVFDDKMRYLSASRRWKKDVGMKDRDLTGLSAYEIHNVPKRWKKVNNRGLAGEVLEEEEDRYRRFDGSVRWIRWKVHPWYSAMGKVGGIVVFAEDITERKRFEKQLRMLNEELEQRVEIRSRELQETHVKYLHAEKLSAIGKLSASIAHEFNNPLQGILTVLKGLQKAGLRGEDSEMLTLAIGESERLKNLIGNLQEFNRPTTGKKVPMDVHAALHSMLLLCKSDFRKKRLSIELDLAEGLTEIHAVADQIKQVFLNLLTNAADACLPGGKISIRTWQQKKLVAIAITDDGIGMEQERMELIFQPFYSTKLETQGTGLGLAICDSIVNDHRGEIRVESQLGKGSTFTVFLPIREG